jgi:IclR family transcriptional regulator, acetate operon repressor
LLLWLAVLRLFPSTGNLIRLMEILQPTAEPSIRSVERALRLITAAVEAADGINLVEAARLTELAPSTATRILKTLENSRFVARREDGAYVAGAELLRLGALHASESPLLNAAQAHLDALAAATGESCYLAIAVDRQWATYIRMTQSTKSLRHVSWLGRRIPRSSSAVGAALAGNTDARGVAIVHDGVEPDTTAVAVPLRDQGGIIVGALNIVGPSFRMKNQLAISTAARSAAEGLELAVASPGTTSAVPRRRAS